MPADRDKQRADISKGENESASQGLGLWRVPHALQEPRLAVTFVENHDTDHLEYCRTFCNGELNGVVRKILNPKS